MQLDGVFVLYFLLATVTVTKAVVAGVFVCSVVIWHVRWLYFDDILYFHRNFYFFVF